MARFVRSHSRYSGCKKRTGATQQSMNLHNSGGHFTNRLLVLSLVSILIWPIISSAALEQTFEVLQIGTHTYRNVTVTTKTKNYIFIMHSTGMENIKLTELPPDILTKLGYSA